MDQSNSLIRNSADIKLISIFCSVVSVNSVCYAFSDYTSSPRFFTRFIKILFVR